MRPGIGRATHQLLYLRQIRDKGAWVIAKMTSHLLRHRLRTDFYVNVQTFEAVPAF
jgi:hypothetical protein